MDKKAPQDHSVEVAALKAEAAELTVDIAEKRARIYALASETRAWEVSQRPEWRLSQDDILTQAALTFYHEQLGQPEDTRNMDPRMFRRLFQILRERGEITDPSDNKEEA